MNKMQLIVLLILSIASTGNCKCNTHTYCSSCANSKYGLISCRWCEETKTCHQPGSVYNKCHGGCKESSLSISCSITDPLKCGTNTKSVSNSGQFRQCNKYRDCLSCANTNFGQMRCRWCPKTNTCHTPGSIFNKCKGCTDNSPSCSVTDTSKCGHKSGQFDSNEAFRAILYSAVAYSDEPVTCANKIKSATDELEIVEVIGRKCEYLFKYKECVAVSAVSHSLKKIILAYRGTSSITQLVDEVLSVLKTKKVSAKIGGQVQNYFNNANNQLYPCVKSSVKDLVNKYPKYGVIIAGHSLGGAIASIASTQLVYDEVTDTEKTTVYTFGMPRPGDRTFALNQNTYITKSWRIVHFRDIVAKLPKKTNAEDSPFHHQKEIFYGANMGKDSDYIECFGYEDITCSQGYSFSTSSLNYHKVYYGINVGSHCDEQTHKRRKRSDAASDMSHLLTFETCRRIPVGDMVASDAIRSINEVAIIIVILLHLTLKFVTGTLHVFI